MKRIDEWKAESIQSTIEYVNEIAKRDSEWRDKYGWRRIEYEDYRKEVPHSILELSKIGKTAMLEKVTKMVEKHFEKLQAKVEAKIGTIEEIEETGNNGHDYRFIGTDGFCSVEVIGAGGYNIQRYHTRWIIK